MEAEYHTMGWFASDRYILGGGWLSVHGMVERVSL
jgi:hypothetical protein